MPSRRSLAWISLYGLLVAAVSCSTPDCLTLDAVGPISGAPARESSRKALGFLEVKTKPTRILDGAMPYYRNTPYTIQTLEGKPFKSVANHAGPTDQKPMVVRLPAGQYLVYAQSEGYGLVAVPVAIVPYQLTQVNLRYEGLIDNPTHSETNWSRLPDGRIVGRRVSPTADAANSN